MTKIKVYHIEGIEFAYEYQEISCVLSRSTMKFLDEEENTLTEIVYSDIQNLSILEGTEEVCKNNESVIARTIVGGLLAGSIGAIVGGISSLPPTFKEKKINYFLIELPKEKYYGDIVITADNKSLKKITDFFK